MMSASPGPYFGCCHLAVVCFLLFLCRDSLSIVVTDVSLITAHGKNDYVLHGEEATLVCMYLMTSDDEVLTSVQWLLNGEEVYLWTNTQPPRASGALQGRVDLRNKSPREVKIQKAHMNMHGKYVCRIKTDQGVEEDSLDVIVIVDSCKESSWETYSDMIQCTETVSLHCAGMYPKPSPQCGVVDRVTQAYVISIPWDQNSRLPNGTYEIRMQRRLEIQDWINYTDITFSCEMIVKDTTWKKGIRHKLFGDRGCSFSPPELEEGYHNMTEGKTCWGNPRDGVLAHYTCLDTSLKAVPGSMVCRNGSWVPAAFRNGSWVLDHDGGLPRCGGSCLWTSFPSLLFLLPVSGLSYTWISSNSF